MGSHKQMSSPEKYDLTKIVRDLQYFKRKVSSIENCVDTMVSTLLERVHINRHIHNSEDEYYEEVAQSCDDDFKRLRKSIQYTINELQKIIAQKSTLVLYDVMSQKLGLDPYTTEGITNRITSYASLPNVSSVQSVNRSSTLGKRKR